MLEKVLVVVLLISLVSCKKEVLYVDQAVNCKPVSLDGGVSKVITYDAQGRVLSIIEQGQENDRYTFLYSKDSTWVIINDEDTLIIELNSKGYPIRAVNGPIDCEISYSALGKVESVNIRQVSAGSNVYTWAIYDLLYVKGDLVLYTLEQMNPERTWAEQVYATYDTTIEYKTFDPLGFYHALFLLDKKSSLALFDPQIFSDHLIKTWDRRELGWRKLIYDHSIDDHGNITEITLRETLDNSFSEDSRLVSSIEVAFDCE